MAATDAWYVFVNPHAGSYKKWPEVEALMRTQGLTFEQEITESVEELADKVVALIANGARKFIAIGGDGSCHVMINALIQQQLVPVNELVFANISCGTGNDWQRGRHWPKGLKEQVTKIKAGKTEGMDIGQVSYADREAPVYFFNMLGLSYDAYVVHNLASGDKKNIGPLVYIYSVVKYIFKYEIPILRLQFNGKRLEKKMYTVNVGMGTHAGSGMEILPHARERGDQFAVLIANDMSKARVLMESLRFYTGRIHHSTKVDTYFTKEIKADAIDIPLLVEADGELLPTGAITVRILGNYLRTIAV